MALSRRWATGEETEGAVAHFPQVRDEAGGPPLSTVSGAQEFEARARKAMSEFFGVELNLGTCSNVPKEFDMVVLVVEQSAANPHFICYLDRNTQLDPSLIIPSVKRPSPSHTLSARLGDSLGRVPTSPPPLKIECQVGGI